MERNTPVLTVVALSLLALAAVAGATAADGAATARQAQESTNVQTDPTATFADDRITVEEGQVAAIDVRLNGTSNATVVLGSTAGGYVLEVDVTDGNGDDKVGLQFDTATAGGDGSPVAAFRDADGAAVRSETSLDGDLAARGYSLQVYTGEPSGEPADTAVLLVQADETTTTTTPPTTETTTADPTTSTATTTSGDGTTTTDGQPGFGLLVALVGVVAATLLAARR